MVRIFALALLLISSAAVFADDWMPYTDGRSGGCWISSTRVLYGCTPQPQTNNQSQKADTAAAMSVEEKCLRARYALKDPDRTMRTIRAAEETIEQLGCK